MELSLQLFGYLVLTLLGIVTPILVILLSIFQEGVSKLSAQYENEKSSSEDNLKAQLKKISDEKDTNVDEIENSIKKLKKIKRKARNKISYLNPKKQILKIFFFLLFSFLTLLIELQTNLEIFGVKVFILLSFIFFILSLYILWKELCIIIEVKTIIDIENNETESKILELLSTIANKGGDYFLEKVFLNIMDNDIDEDDKQISLENVNLKQSIEISLSNREARMAKNIEAGIVFPKSFIVEKSTVHTIYIDNNGDQIVRYNLDSLHADTIYSFIDLQITPIESGTFRLRTFLKAENIETINKYVKFKVLE